MAGDQLNYKEIAVILTIAKVTKDLIEDKAQPDAPSVRFYYSQFLEMVQRPSGSLAAQD